MADTWLTIEQAAVALGMSVRTVNRHIAGDKLQSRLTDGRREVLVSLPDETPSASPEQNEPIEASFGNRHLPSDTGGHYQAAHSATVNIPGGHHQGGFDHASVLALADNAAEKAEMAVAAYQALARSTDQQFQHVRRSARFAWASVAVMAAGVSVAVGWTTHHLTRSQVTTQYLKQRVEETTTASDRLSVERDTLKLELSAAREHAARAEGRAATLTEVQARREAQAQSAQAQLPKSDGQPNAERHAEPPQAEPKAQADAVTDEGPIESDAPTDTSANATSPATGSPRAPSAAFPTTKPTFMDKISSLVNRPTE